MGSDELKRFEETTIPAAPIVTDEVLAATQEFIKRLEAAGASKMLAALTCLDISAKLYRASGVTKKVFSNFAYNIYKNVRGPVPQKYRGA